MRGWRYHVNRWLTIWFAFYLLSMGFFALEFVIGGHLGRLAFQNIPADWVGLALLCLPASLMWLGAWHFGLWVQRRRQASGRR